MSWVVHHSVVATSSAISVTESARTGRERRSILPGSPMITATSRMALDDRHTPARARDEAVRKQERQ